MDVWLLKHIHVCTNQILDLCSITIDCEAIIDAGREKEATEKSFVYSNSGLCKKEIPWMFHLTPTKK